jgi:hypothetical protein
MVFQSVRGSRSGYTAELQVYAQQLSQVGQIRQLMAISSFINLEGEDALVEPEASST